jgi:hypothetical protein
MADNIKDFAVNSARWLSLENFEGEVWKDFSLNDIYQLSNYGRLKIKERIEIIPTKRSNKPYTAHFSAKIKKPQLGKHYYMASITINGKQKNMTIHRMVCMTFHDNPNNLPEINHKDENKLNNMAENLEWCNRLYNVRYGTGIKRMAVKMKNRKDQSKKVYQFDFKGNLVAEFPSASEASRILGVTMMSIVGVCLGKRFSIKGYIWSYNKNKTEIMDRISKMNNSYRSSVYNIICQYSLDGKFIAEYENVTNAANKSGVKACYISRCLHNKRKSGGGYIWKFKC